MHESYDEKFSTEEGNAAAVIAMVRDHVRPTTLTLEHDEEGGPRIVALPAGLRLESLRKFEDERLERPRRREGTAELTTLESFCDHVTRFCDHHSAVFARDDRDRPELLAVLDYHEGRENNEEARPRFGVHRSRYRFPLSDAWKAWTGLAAKGFVDQATFASFLEDHLDDVLEPGAVGGSVSDWAHVHGVSLAGQSRLTELARGLTLHAAAKVTQIQNPNTGEARIGFEETHHDDAGAPIRIPGGLAIAIAVFRGGALYQVPVRLRYRRSGASVVWAVAPHRVDRVFDDAFDEACSKVVEATELPLLYGLPEGEGR